MGSLRQTSLLQVPVLVHEPECYHQFEYWDLACDVVKCCVDGEKYVPLIAQVAGMSVKHVQVVPPGFLFPKEHAQNDACALWGCCWLHCVQQHPSATASQRFSTLHAKCLLCL